VLRARVDRASREDVSLAETQLGRSGLTPRGTPTAVSGTDVPPPGGEGPTGEFARPPAPSGELDLLAPEASGHSALGRQRVGSSFEALESADLVMLDGSRDEIEAPKPPGASRASSDAAELAFAPPDRDELLELDRPPPPRASPAPRYVSQELLPPEEPAPEEPPPVAALAEEALALDERALPKPKPLPQLPPEPERERVLAAPRSMRRSGPALRAQQAAGRLLFGGWFRERPRLRIAVGFALALGLGGIVPACHARSVLSSRVTPQLEDLSTARAHGHLLSRLPNYRSPEEIERAISDIKLKSGILSFVLWLLIGGAVCFAWLRFT
jgi:hypothetical protein